MTRIVTIFKDIQTITEPFYRPVEFILNRIKEGASSELVKSIRKETDKEKRNELKKRLPSIVFQGKFSKRSDVALIESSGLMILDFDGYTKKKDLISDKAKFSKNKYVYSVFISPSGKGLKVLIKIPQDPENYVGYFLSLEKHFNSAYFDKTTKNISRVCYESYDPLIYINDKSLVWETKEDISYKEVKVNQDFKTIPITDETKIVDILVRWWTKKYPMIKGQRNQNAYVLAMAFNDFGITKHTASLVLRQYQATDFGAAEIETTIKSAYSHTKNFNTKYYEDEEKINDIQQRLRRGESKKAVRQHLEESMLDTEVIDSVLEKAEEDNSVKFWTKNDKGVIKTIPLIFKKFLETNGFHKYCPEDQKNYVFVKVNNGLIEHTNEKEIKDFILDYLMTLDDISIYNYFAEQTRLFKEDYLTLLSTIDIFFMEDTKDVSYLYYENCAIKISKEDVETIDYLELDGYVWRDHVINRSYVDCKIKDCDYKKFISNVCDQSPERIKTMESTIGYMLHSYKNVSNCPAVILNDEVISDTANGGTGKGLWLQALGHMKKLVMIDGKAFNFEKSFPYQLVSADTQILVFDDVKKNFEIERLFSVITEGLTLEKKNKDAIKIPFSKSPKICISTNYALRGSGNSFARRKWDLELSQHYNKIHTPIDDFNKYLFGDWDNEEWCQFDNYMIKCTQLFLKNGLITSDFVNLNIRKLIMETNPEFVEWCGLTPKGSDPNPYLVTNEWFYSYDLYRQFIEDNPEFGKLSLKPRTFNRWIVSYCMYKEGLEPEKKKTNKKTMMRIRPRSEGITQQKLM
tara:strand:+ start:486 stop:2891 length:2406 start_codon:yes stop_codon:yes gene_type:complete